MALDHFDVVVAFEVIEDDFDGVEAGGADGLVLGWPLVVEFVQMGVEIG